jgi:hypothetical protein
MNRPTPSFLIELAVSAAHAPFGLRLGLQGVARYMCYVTHVINGVTVTFETLYIARICGETFLKVNKL